MSLVKLGRFSRYAGWSAYVSALLSVVGFAFLFLLYFYALQPNVRVPGGGNPLDFGHLNDIVGLFAPLCMLPLPVALHALTSHRRPGLSWAAIALGVSGLLSIILAQMLLLAQVITFEMNLPFTMIGLVLLGAWLILANQLGRVGGALSRRLGWLGELNGAAFLLAIGGILLVNLPNALAAGRTSQQSPALFVVIIVLATPGALAYFIGFPLWIIGLGHRLLASPLAPELSNQRPAPLGAL